MVGVVLVHLLQSFVARALMETLGQVMVRNLLGVAF